MINFLQHIFWGRSDCGQNRARGFTLVETIVAVGLFTIVTTIASSALLNMINSDRMSRGTRIATDNLNLALEDMTRRMKTGTEYHCGNAVSFSGVQDCLSGVVFSFDDHEGVRTAYMRGAGSGTTVSGGCGNGYRDAVGLAPAQGCLLRWRMLPLETWRPSTSNEIDIQTVSFIAGGTTHGPGGNPPGADTKQPYVVVVVGGVIETNNAIKPGFKMETMITQRQPDL